MDQKSNIQDIKIKRKKRVLNNSYDNCLENIRNYKKKKNQKNTLFLIKSIKLKDKNSILKKGNKKKQILKSLENSINIINKKDNKLKISKNNDKKIKGITIIGSEKNNKSKNLNIIKQKKNKTYFYNKLNNINKKNKTKIINLNDIKNNRNKRIYKDFIKLEEIFSKL